MIPLRILHVLDAEAASTVRAGPTRLLPWLVGQGHAVASVILGEGGAEHFQPCLGQRLGRWSWWRRGRAAAISAAAAWGCDLVHVHGESALAPGLDIARGIVAQLVAEPATLREPSTYRLLRDGSIAAVLVAGEEQRSVLLADVRVPRDRVVVVPPGVDSQLPMPRQVDGGLVVAARLRRNCDAQCLTEAVTILRQAGLAASAVASVAPGVRLPHHDGIRIVQQGHELMDADVLVELATTDLPMHHVVDALAAGRPVVAVAAGLLHELIQDSRNGELVQAGDPSALAAALRQLAATEPRSAHAAAALRSARRHDINLVGEAVIGIYRAAVGGSAAGGATTWKRLTTERLRRRTSGRQRTSGCSS